MTEQQTRVKLLADGEDVLKTLPQMGKLMINSKNGGATHERIGVVETVKVDGGWIYFSGAHHHSCIDLSAIAALVVDRSSVMQGNVYPRLDLMAQDGHVIGSVIGFDGVEPFDLALKGFAFSALPAKTKEQTTGEALEIADGDPGLKPFAAAWRNKAQVRIALDLPAFKQEWSGEIPQTRLSRGFINLMQPDFHLHLKGGHVASWLKLEKANEELFYALNENGEKTGLVVSGSKGSFQ